MTKLIATFANASTVQVSLDAIITPNDSGCAKFTEGRPIKVYKGQQLIITTNGIWLEELEEPYQEDSYED